MNFITNWKTSAGGVVLIAIAALSTFAGVHVPGFTMDFGTALTAGMALIFAKDAA